MNTTFNPFASAAAGILQQHNCATVPGRTLVIDGDSLAYRCAGDNETSFAEARKRAQDCISDALRASGADPACVVVLLTSPNSLKGNRFIDATVKEYQGNRDKARRTQPQRVPLRAWLSEQYPNNFLGDVWEADDGFAAATAWAKGRDVVLHYDDKDMRQITGVFHLTWKTLELLYVHDHLVVNGVKPTVYGRVWLAHQLLRGDPTDNVPGLPYITRPDKPLALCGDVRAASILKGATKWSKAIDLVAYEYTATYGDDAAARLAEQILLLGLGTLDWMGDAHNTPSSEVAKEAVRQATTRRLAFAVEHGGPAFELPSVSGKA